jgi:hypothetical protein
MIAFTCPEQATAQRIAHPADRFAPDRAFFEVISCSAFAAADAQSVGRLPSMLGSRHGTV